MRGTTLLELIFVIAIMCLVLAMAAPSMRGFFGARKTSNAASQMLVLMKKAQSQAIAEGRIYRFNLDVEEGTYWLTADERGEFDRISDEFGRTFTLPDGAVAAWLDEGNATERENVEFYPDATTQQAVIRLIGREGKVLDLACPSATDFFRIESPGDDGNT